MASKKILIQVILDDKNVAAKSNQISKSVDGITQAQQKYFQALQPTNVEIEKYKILTKEAQIATQAKARAELNAAEATKAGRAQSGLNNAILLETGRLASDASYGFTAIANNLSQVVTLFASFVKTNDGVRALLLVVMADRGITRAAWGYKLDDPDAGITPSKTIGAGQGQEEGASNNLGAKKDLVDLYCGGEAEGHTREKIRDNIRKNVLGEDFARKNYSTKCGEEPRSEAELNHNVNDNIERMIQDRPDIGEGCLGVAREPKTHTNINEKSTLGETSHAKQTNALNYLCKGKTEFTEDKGKKTMGGLSKQEVTRLDEVADYMADCTKLSGTIKKACEFHESLAGVLRVPMSILEGATVKGQPHAAEAMFETWLANKRPQDIKKARERMKGAKRCLKNVRGVGGFDKLDETLSSSKDCDHLKKIKGEIYNAYYARKLDEHTNKDGKVEGAGKEYLRTVYALTAGSDVEVLNQKIGLEENIEKVGLRNAEIDKNLNYAEFKRNKRKSVGAARAKTQRKGVESGKAKALKKVQKPKKGDKQDEPSEEVEMEAASEDRWRETQRWASTVAIEDTTGVSQASISIEGNTYKVKTGDAKDLYREIYNNNIEKDQVAADQEKRDAKKIASAEAGTREKGQVGDALLMNFLKGQQELLEKLIDHTT